MNLKWFLCPGPDTILGANLPGLLVRMIDLQTGQLTLMEVEAVASQVPNVVNILRACDPSGHIFKGRVAREGDYFVARLELQAIALPASAA